MSEKTSETQPELTAEQIVDSFVDGIYLGLANVISDNQKAEVKALLLGMVAELERRTEAKAFAEGHLAGAEYILHHNGFVADATNDSGDIIGKEVHLLILRGDDVTYWPDTWRDMLTGKSDKLLGRAMREKLKASVH